jgi:hypothetical protein
MGAERSAHTNTTRSIDRESILEVYVGGSENDHGILLSIDC